MWEATYIWYALPFIPFKCGELFWLFSIISINQIIQLIKILMIVNITNSFSDFIVCIINKVLEALKFFILILIIDMWLILVQLWFLFWNNCLLWFMSVNLMMQIILRWILSTSIRCFVYKFLITSIPFHDIQRNLLAIHFFINF